MEVWYAILSWGSPLGLGLFLFLSLSGTAFFFWGLKQLQSRDE